MTNAIIEINRAKSALAKAQSIHEVLEIKSSAMAMALLADARGAKETAIIAKEIELRSARKAGDFLQDIQRRSPMFAGGEAEPSTVYKETLNASGVGRTTAWRWQQLADLPDEEFEAYIAKGHEKDHELSTRGAVSVARRYKRDRKQERERKAIIEKAEPQQWLAGEFQLDHVYVADTITKQFRDTLPDDFIDMIATDPPWSEEGLECYEGLGALAVKKLRPGGICMAYTTPLYMPECIELLSAYLDYVWTVCAWQPDNNIRIWKWELYPTYKPILIFKKPGGTKPTFDWSPDGLKVTRQKSWHQWEQGPDAFFRYIRIFTNPGDLVVDPFSGGGTVPYCAKRLNRHFIAFDKDEKAVAMTQARLELADEHGPWDPDGKDNDSGNDT